MKIWKRKKFYWERLSVAFELYFERASLQKLFLYILSSLGHPKQYFFVKQIFLKSYWKFEKRRKYFQMVTNVALYTVCILSLTLLTLFHHFARQNISVDKFMTMYYFVELGFLSKSLWKQEFHIVNELGYFRE